MTTKLPIKEDWSLGVDSEVQRVPVKEIVTVRFGQHAELNGAQKVARELTKVVPPETMVFAIPESIKIESIDLKELVVLTCEARDIRVAGNIAKHLRKLKPTAEILVLTEGRELSSYTMDEVKKMTDRTWDDLADT